jgi:heterodisulfide reductase subunit A-like polyferredoxin
VADVPAVREYARGLPYVVHVEDNLFTCSQDTQDKMKAVIREKGLNRVVVASCSPRTHEPLFQETIREAGLNKYLFEMANIRDQDTWVHMNDPRRATAKARDLVRMAVAKAACIEPLHRVSLDIVKAALVVGGGVAGMETALGLADQGCRVYLVERAAGLGGVARNLRHAWQNEPVAPYLKDLIERTVSHPSVEVFTETVVTGTGGSVGHFTTRLASINGRANAATVVHGVTILATGGRELAPADHLYGQHPDVLTHLDLEAAFEAGDPRLARAGSVLFIQCVGSRTPERPYCSKVCCTHSLRAALTLHEKNPKARIYIAYRDIRAFGRRETLYRQARQKGVIFIRYDLGRPPKVRTSEGRRLKVELQDHVLRSQIRLRPDLVVLASAVVPNDNQTLFEMFKVPVNADGFLIEAHAKLRPVDLAADGIFMAGLAHWPKPLEETIAQARAACARAMTLLSHERIMVGGIVATVDPGRCALCLTCVRTCPYGVPRVGAHAHAEIEPALCHGCGTCAAECPGKAIELQHYTDAQLIAKTAALFAETAA